ncbi:hypothetical protein QJQ45_023387 [Haematococcus lacustris]|nr:hypothetical protein QJQ45_023387 [Haematococcus lacustris]
MLMCPWHRLASCSPFTWALSMVASRGCRTHGVCCAADDARADGDAAAIIHSLLLRAASILALRSGTLLSGVSCCPSAASPPCLARATQRSRSLQEQPEAAEEPAGLTCGHAQVASLQDQYLADFASYAAAQAPAALQTQRARALQQSSRGTLRFNVSFQLGSQVPAALLPITTRLVWTAVRVIQKFVQVLVPAPRALFVRPGLVCAPAVVPETWRLNSSAPPGALQGVPGADYLLLVTAQLNHSACINNTLAWAMACDFDLLSGRPTLGVINICPGLLTSLTSISTSTPSVGGGNASSGNSSSSSGSSSGRNESSSNSSNRSRGGSGASAGDSGPAAGSWADVEGDGSGSSSSDNSSAGSSSSGGSSSSEARRGVYKALVERGGSQGEDSSSYEASATLPADFTPDGDPPSAAGSGLLEGQALDALVHELVHALGFHFSLLSSFRQATGAGGNPVTGRPLPVTVLNRTLPSSPRPVSFLATPRVQQEARRSLGCDAAPGAQLEDEGSAGQALHHWEFRFFHMDLMTPLFLSGVRSRVTGVTLAALQDSGWYAPRWDYVQPPVARLAPGCEAVTTPCAVSQARSPGQYYCSTNGTASRQASPGCLSATVPGMCQAATPFSNGCGLVRPATPCTSPALATAPRSFGSYYGPDSRCLLLSSTSTAATPACFQTSCGASGLLLTPWDPPAPANLSCPVASQLGLQALTGRLEELLVLSACHAYHYAKGLGLKKRPGR